MKKNVLIALLFVLWGFSANAYDGHAPLQAMINRERSQHVFKEVSNLWLKGNDAHMSIAARHVKRARFFTLNMRDLAEFMKENNRCINLNIPGLDADYKISLTQYAPFTGSFSIDEDNGQKLIPFAYNPGLYYRGVVDGIPGSLAVFSFFNNEVYGLFSLPGVGNIVLVPNTSVPSNATSPEYILYNDLELLPSNNKQGCANEKLPNPAKSAAGMAKNVFNSCKEIKIYARTDYQTYVDMNNNTTSIANYVTSIFNLTSTLYRNEGIYLALNKLIINTTPDVYQTFTFDPLEFITSFAQTTGSAMQGSDLAILLSSAYSASMGGLGYLDVLCTTGQTVYPYTGPYSFANIDLAVQDPFPMYSWNTGCVTHEFGHNLGSPHTHACGVWSNGEAIDGCFTLEGFCNINGPQYPVNGGTIMSYCHTVIGVGINFANGFGQEPGDLIRNTVNAASCPVIYAPNVPLTTTILSSANRECTDPTGVTYYWDDGLNADTSGDRILMKIKKGTNNIGDLDQLGFSVKGSVLTGYGNGTAINFTPYVGSGLSGNTNGAMRRYWTVTPMAQPVTPVDIYVPFTNTDVSDIDGSVPGTIGVSNLIFYNLASTSVNPNPSSGLAGSNSTNMKLLNNGSNSTTTTWKSSPVGTTQFAQYQASYLAGGSAFVNYNSTGIESISSKNISVYPNPFTDNWNITIPEGEMMILQVFSTDGKIVHTQSIQPGVSNSVNNKTLPSGLYFYRITGSLQTFTGSIARK